MPDLASPSREAVSDSDDLAGCSGHHVSNRGTSADETAGQVDVDQAYRCPVHPMRYDPDRDYYIILQVDPRANPKVIAFALKALQMIYHDVIHQ